MNRKEMGLAVAGALGALVGTACSAPQGASGLPALSANLEPACALGSLISIPELLLAAPSSPRSPFSTFRARKAARCTVTSLDPAVCTVEEFADGRVVFSAVSVGHARIDVDDSAARKERIDVYVVAAS
jgi:hypothetical protein